MSGNALRRSAQPSRSRVASSLAALCGTFLTDADQYHLLRYASLVDRHPHEHPRGRQAPIGTELMRTCQANWASARVATPLSPILHGFVQVPQRRVLLNSPLPQHFGTDYFGVVIPLSRRVPAVVARFGLGCC